MITKREIRDIIDNALNVVNISNGTNYDCRAVFGRDSETVANTLLLEVVRAEIQRKVFETYKEKDQ